MRPTTIGILAGALLGVLSLGVASPAAAHFLWAETKTAPRPSLRLTFTEAAGEQTLATLLPRIQVARARTADGKPLTLKPGDGALRTDLPAGAVLVGVEQTWGVIERDGQTFLLQYYAKAAADPAAAAKAANLHVELFARRDGADWHVSVKHGPRPERDAELTIHRPGATEPLTLQTDERGEARFPATGEGLCAIRARVIETENGEFEGKAYAQKRYYSTLTFPVSGPLAGQPVRQAAGTRPAKADPRAYALLKAAHNSRQTMPPGFRGFTADVILDDDGTLTRGKMGYVPGDGVELTIAGADEKAEHWLRGALSNAIGHRRGGDFARGDGRHPITFTSSEDRSPLGRQVSLNDGLNSSYRVRDNKVTEVTRTMGDQRFIITVLETRPADAGKYLPRHFTVTYFDPETGSISQTQSFSDEYARIQGVWLPVSRRVITAADGKISSRRFELRNIRVTPRPRAASR